MATVGPEQTFQHLGFDSLTGLELRNRLSAATGLRLTATAVFDYPTITGLAANLLDSLLGADAGKPTGPVPAAVAGDPVVIVGMSCRFPGGVAGVASPEDLWQLLTEGRDAITTFPDNRGWDLGGERLAGVHPEELRVELAGVVQEAAFARAGGAGVVRVGIVELQQRLLLECGWEAIERAGIDPVTLRGCRTGVFVGVMTTITA